MTLDAIKEAISALAAPEKTTLIQWLNLLDSDAWDRQLEADFSEGGAGMALLAEWNEEIKIGNVPSEDFLAEQEKHRR